MKKNVYYDLVKSPQFDISIEVKKMGPNKYPSA